MLDDTELLKRYATEKSEEAFAELVRRHVNLVYAAALRQVGGDTHLAQDITQSVFHDLARKAASLSRHRVPTAWLYTSTHFAAAKLLRSEGRRRAREREASIMNQNCSSEPRTDWEQITPVLDAAMHELKAPDREAVLLRYFEGRPLAEVGAKIGLSENAARMRVERALERLRLLLVKRGVTSTTAAALAVALTAQSVSSAPLNLAASITSAMAASTAATKLATATATALKLMSLSKLQVAALSVVVVAGVTTPIVLQHRANQRLRADNAALRQEMDELRQQNTQPATPAAPVIENRLSDSQQADLLRLRGEVAALRRSTQELAQARAEIDGLQAKLRTAQSARQSESKLLLADGLIPALSWKNAGFSTPADTYETLLWAKNYGQLDTLKNAFILDDSARAKADALYASLPDTLRQKYASTELMVAGLLANTTPVAGMRVISQEEASPNEMIVKVQYQYADGRLREDSENFRRSPEGWRQIIPDALIDKAGRMLNQP